MDKPIVDVRIFCQGRCGKYIVVPVSDAVKLINTLGDVLPEVDSYICPSCKGWFNKETCRLLLGGKK